MKDIKTLLNEWRSYEKKILREQEVQPVPEAPPEEGAASGMKITDQTSFKVFDGKPDLALKVMQELLKGGDLFKQLQAAQLGKWYTIKSPEDLKVWVQAHGGLETFAKRAAVIGSKIPEQGLPKSKMPFLPGPKDATGEVGDVKDALTPGGKYNVDMMERTDPPPPNQFTGMDPSGKGPAAAFMTAGLASKDGDPDDDYIKILLGGGFTASSMIPTQTNILLPKGLGMAVNGISGGKLDAYASLKGEILDGHHRWAATMLNDPGTEIGTIARIDLEALGTEDTLKYLTAIGNALGNETKPK